jgi:PAS domain S-box-containing protein
MKSNASKQVVANAAASGDSSPRSRNGSALLFDKKILACQDDAIEFVSNILGSSTEYSIIGQDLSGIIILWNEGARRIYGYEPSEVVAKMDSSSLYAPADVEAKLPEQIMAAVAADGRWQGEITRRRKNGELFTAQIVITRRLDREGHLVGYLLISKDISVEKRLANYARSLIEASLDPLVTISSEGVIMDVNEASIKATGLSRDKLIGTDFADCFTDPDKARAGYQQVFAKGMVTDYPLTIRHQNGSLTDVLYNASVYKDESGKVLGVVAVARDVTEQKLAMAELANLRSERERVVELERFQRLTVGRELKMIELKKEIEELKRLIPPGKEAV